MKRLSFICIFFISLNLINGQEIDNDLLQIKKRMDSIKSYDAQIQLDVDISFINMPKVVSWNISTLLKSISYLGVLYLASYIIINSMISIISGDAGGYYFNIARDVSNGVILYKDLPCTYTPLSIYCWTIPYFLFGDKPEYYLFLL